MVLSKNFKDRVRCVCGVVLAAAVAGCSADRHLYESTVDRPTTVTLEDPYSNDVIWEMAIPVDYKLLVDLDRRGENETDRISGMPATSMSWKLWSMRQRPKRGKIDLPGTPVILRVAYRPAPEYPEGYREALRSKVEEVEAVEMPAAEEPLVIEPAEPEVDEVEPLEMYVAPAEEAEPGEEVEPAEETVVEEAQGRGGAASDRDTVEIELDDMTVQIDVDAAVTAVPKQPAADEPSEQDD